MLRGPMLQDYGGFYAATAEGELFKTLSGTRLDRLNEFVVLGCSLGMPRYK
jgi:hypothetical protein